MNLIEILHTHFFLKNQNMREEIATKNRTNLIS